MKIVTRKSLHQNKELIAMNRISEGQRLKGVPSILDFAKRDQCRVSTAAKLFPTNNNSSENRTINNMEKDGNIQSNSEDEISFKASTIVMKSEQTEGR